MSELRYSGFDLVCSRIYLFIDVAKGALTSYTVKLSIQSKCLKSCSAVYIKSVKAYEQLSTYNMSNYLNNNKTKSYIWVFLFAVHCCSKF